MNGTNNFDGKVEIYTGNWDSICTYSWDIKDSDVVCRELGFEGANEALYNKYYRSSYYSNIISGVYCQGNESTIFECNYPFSYTRYCSYEAGVVCIG